MRIERVEAIPVRLGFLGDFATARGTIGSAGGGAVHVLVKLTADDGAVGWGECRPSPRWSDETPEGAVSTIRTYWAPVLLGRDPCDLLGIDRALTAEIAPGLALGQPIARAAVDLALHDLVGKLAGLPLQALFGGTAQRTIRLSWTVLGHDEESVAASVAAGRARGYRDFSVKVGFGAATDRIIATTLAAAAPGAFLWADANGGYTVDQAVAASRLLADLGYAVLEQPLPANQWTDYPDLRRRSALPIGMDEGIVDPTVLLQLVRSQAIDVFTLKIGRMGGLRRARQAIAIAEAAGLRVLGSGLTEAGLMLAGYAHLLSAHGIATPNALNGPQLLSELLTDLVIEGDEVTVPFGPGLGVTVDEARVAELAIEL